MIIHFIIVLIAGIAGSALFVRLKVPAGAMLGAMCAVAVLNCLTDMVYYPASVRKLIMIFSGAVIGTRVTRESLRQIQGILRAAAISVVSLVVMNMLFGGIICQFSELDLVTSVFAATPGGITDITFIAMEYGAEGTSIVFLHMVRLIAAVLILPFLIRGYSAFCASPAEAEGAEKGGEPFILKKTERIIDSAGKMAITLVIAAASGILGGNLGIPGGILTSAVIGVALCNLCWGRCEMPSQSGKWLQCFSGLYLGSQVTVEFLSQMKELFIPAVIMVVAVVVWGVAIAGIISRMTGMDYRTAVLACAPGGIQEMSLIGEEMGLDIAVITVLQTIRIVVSVALIPFLLSFILWQGG